MAESVKIQITISQEVAEKLAVMCASKGLSKSALCALAISELYGKEDAEK